MTNMTNIIKNVPQETINTVLIDILKGAKDAGHEIYGASKTGIIKAVDFAQEQAPLVVQEFLSWNFAQAIVWTIVWIIGLFLIGYLIKKGNSDVNDFETQFFSIIFGGIVFGVVLFAGLIPNVEKMIKVKVAPRVYTIEWVSKQVNSRN